MQMLIKGEEKMKKLIITLLALNLAVVSYAALSVHKAESRLATVVLNIYNVAKQSAINLNNLKQEGNDIVTTHGTSLDSSDRTKLIAYGDLVIDAKDALDAVVYYKDTNWGNLE